MTQATRPALSDEIRAKLLTYQENEITEHHIYNKLADVVDSPDNSRILREIAEDELGHYHDWREYTQQDVEPNWWRVQKYFLISRIFGFTFGIKLMERGEEGAQEEYESVRHEVEKASAIRVRRLCRCLRVSHPRAAAYRAFRVDLIRKQRRSAVVEPDSRFAVVQERSRRRLTEQKKFVGPACQLQETAAKGRDCQKDD